MLAIAKFTVPRAKPAVPHCTIEFEVGLIQFKLIVEQVTLAFNPVGGRQEGGVPVVVKQKGVDGVEVSPPGHNSLT